MELFPSDSQYWTLLDLKKKAQRFALFRNVCAYSDPEHLGTRLLKSIFEKWAPNSTAAFCASGAAGDKMARVLSTGNAVLC